MPCRLVFCICVTASAPVSGWPVDHATWQPNRNPLSEPRNEVHAGMISKRSHLPPSQPLNASRRGDEKRGSSYVADIALSFSRPSDRKEDSVSWLIVDPRTTNSNSAKERYDTFDNKKRRNGSRSYRARSKFAVTPQL